MKERKVRLENRELVILLCVLLVAIAGLVIGIVVVNMNSDNVTEEQLSEDQISYNSYVEYADTYKDIDIQVKEMLKREPVDVSAINKLYNEQILKNIENGELDRASSYIYAQRDNLLAGGFLQEALEASLAIDYSVFDEPEQYRQYKAIVEIAQDLGRTDIAAEYEAKMGGVRAAYEASYFGAEAAAEAAENFKIPEEDEE